VKGVDIRTVGSGNVGATNAGRAIGSKWAFVLVMLLDALKGFLPVFLLLLIFGEDTIVLFAACAVILGHTFPIFLGFKGGKGVATGFGVFLALAPMAVFIAFGVFVVVVLFSKMISLGSITAALVLSAGVVMTKCWPAMWVLTWLIAVFVIYKHRSNIRRILDGNENKITLFRK